MVLPCYSCPTRYLRVGCHGDASAHVLWCRWVCPGACGGAAGTIRVEEEVAAAYAGDNVKLRLKGVEEEVCLGLMNETCLSYSLLSLPDAAM